MARLRMPTLRNLRPRRVGTDERLAVHEHLDELRRRLFVALTALIVAFIAMYVVHTQLLDVLLWPLPEDNRELLTLSPTEPFMTVLKVSFFAALLVALPVCLYQLYAFVIPAVADQARKKMLLVVAGVSALFLAGVAFTYFVVANVALDWLLGFGGDQFVTQLRAADYIGFVMMLLLGGGLLFEVPVAMLALARMGVVTGDQFRRNRRIALVVIAVIAAALPGGDPISMLLLMAPQLVLYEVGIRLAMRFGSTPIWERETWVSDEEPAAPQQP
jgi:sec-independent protein translocase protein TatC